MSDVEIIKIDGVITSVSFTEYSIGLGFKPNGSISVEGTIIDKKPFELLELLGQKFIGLKEYEEKIVLLFERMEFTVERKISEGYEIVQIKTDDYWNVWHG